jgi:hypothetical protein
MPPNNYIGLSFVWRFILIPFVADVFWRAAASVKE